MDPGYKAPNDQAPRQADDVPRPPGDTLTKKKKKKRKGKKIRHTKPRHYHTEGRTTQDMLRLDEAEERRRRPQKF